MRFLHTSDVSFISNAAAKYSGYGIGIGKSLLYDNISNINKGENVIIVISSSVDFKDAANSVNNAIKMYKC